jgi:DNA-binding MarR family transcriptional regulator
MIEKKELFPQIYHVIFREKPTEMLLFLLEQNKETYASLLAKHVDCTYSHVVKVLKDMQQADLVKFKKNGRVKYIVLTKKGETLAEHIKNAKLVMRS